MSSYRDNNNITNNSSFSSKLLRKISNWGMDTDNLLYRNSQATGVNEIPYLNNGSQEMNYDIFSQNAVAQIYEKKAISYLDRSYAEKLRLMREYSIKDEIRDFITTVCDEAILYDEDEDFCYPVNLPEEFDKDIKKKYLESFNTVYRRLGFSDGKKAWDIFKRFIIDGFIAYEIIYDDKYKEIISIKMLDPSTLMPGIDPTTGDSIWIQHPENPQFRKILLDSQIVYISYSAGSDYGEMSYIEGLIRPYNQLKLLEQTRIMFNIINVMINKKFVIPISGMNKSTAKETISKLIADYKDEITFDDTFGTVSINGKAHIPYSKEYWFPEGESGTPTVELMKNEGHNLNENDMLTWFYNALKRASKIPFTRFDKDNGGGNIFGDISDLNREEVTFFYFIQRLRTTFKEIIIKPWRIQMLLDYPELIDDENFLRHINIRFNGVNLMHEWKKLANLSKRADIAGSLLSSLTNADGTPYFSPDFLVREIMKMDDETLLENERWKNKKPGGTGQGTGGDTGISDDFGNASDMDSDMDTSMDSGTETDTDTDTTTDTNDEEITF